MGTFIKILESFPAVISFVIQFSLIVVLSFFLRLFWKNVLIRLAKKTSTNLDRLLFEATARAIQITFIAFGLSLTWKLYGEGIVRTLSIISWVNTDFVLNASNHFCFLFLSFSLIYLIWKALFALVDWFEKDIASRTENTLDEKIIYSLRKLFKTVFVVICFIIMSKE